MQEHEVSQAADRIIIARMKARAVVLERIAELAAKCDDLAVVTDAFRAIADADNAQDALDKAPGGMS